MMYVCMMHISMIHDPDYDGYINDSRPLTLVHVSLMLISMILDPDACISDAGFFPDGRTDERTSRF